MQASNAVPATCPSEWIRIFAARLALSRPDISAEEVVRTAIGEYRCSGHLPPETVPAHH